MKVGILNIGTGNYRHYFPALYYTIKKYFLPDHQKQFFFFCDFPEKYPDDVMFLQIERKGFPGDTLLRYHYFSAAEKYIRESGVEVLYYLDVDMLINDIVGDEILPSESHGLVATAHPGFFNNHTPTAPLGTPETRVESTAYVSDMQKNLIAVWHDESHLNRYLISHQDKVKTLLPSYCYPESWNLPYPKKILALDKDHEAIRK